MSLELFYMIRIEAKLFTDDNDTQNLGGGGGGGMVVDDDNDDDDERLCAGEQTPTSRALQFPSTIQLHRRGHIIHTNI